jgi:DNA (cytosine-5)-methyltransferase 1
MRIDAVSKKYNVVDLFCGCGGFSLGFHQAGFNICAGVDIWEDAITTFKSNFPDATVLGADMNMITGDSLTKLLDISKKDVDVIIGGPPCQGFSLSGKRNVDDPRNNLYKSFVQIVQSVKPKVFLLENVPGLVRLFNGKALESILTDFSALGYKVTYELLSADGYGVPQKRRRVFIVGIDTSKLKHTQEFDFPDPSFGDKSENPLLTCKDAISDLDFVPDDYVLGEDIEYKLPAETFYQKVMRSNSTRLLNHSITLHTARTKEIIAMVPNGGNYKALPQELWSTRKVNIAWTRMDSNKPCFTIDTGHNHHFHYRANRVPTVRESARIQSFPDSFKFIGIKTSQLKQVGNAVPPLLVEALAYEIKKVLNKG